MNLNSDVFSDKNKSQLFVMGSSLISWTQQSYKDVCFETYCNWKPLSGLSRTLAAAYP